MNLGIVASQIIFGANAIRDTAASILDATGGRNRSYEKVFDDAREEALKSLQAKAMALGANAILGIRIDYHSLGAGNSALMVAAYGTAVSLKRSEREREKDREFTLREEARFFVEINGAEKGPFSLNQLQELIQAGRINQDSLIREDGQETQVKASAALG